MPTDTHASISPHPDWRPSPNHGERRGGAIDMVVLHYTAMPSAEAAIARLCDPAAGVSAHYLIAADGGLCQMVEEDRRAWHAGAGQWGDVTDVNSRSIGIELDNLGVDTQGTPVPFAAAQMTTLETLLVGLLERHSIPPARVIGHADMAPGRKQDPGPAFDWRRLALSGLSIWPAPHPLADVADPRGTFRRAAHAFGYPIRPHGPWDGDAKAVWRAFADRFCPGERALGAPSAQAAAQAAALAARWPVRRGD